LEKKVPPNFQTFGSKTLFKISAKSFAPIPTIPQEEIDFAKKCISTFFIKYDQISDHEVIKGNFDLSPLNKDSVNGFGYEKDKDLYIDFANGTPTPNFQKFLEEFMERARKDDLTIKDVLFYEAMKDELRPIAKKDKPRSFRVAPLHHTYLVKKFLGNLFIHCRKNMWNNQIAVGMNPYLDWNTLYKHLRKNDILFDGDVGNWDGGTNSQVQDAISEIVLDFYTGKDKEVLNLLLTSMVRSYVLIRERLYLSTHSMPSGCWVTAFFNSLYNRFITALVLYREMKKDNKIPSVTDFLKLTDFVLGDDKLCGAPTSHAKYFNAFTVKNYFNSLGMKYTDGDKGEILSESKPIHELCFLKRGFKFHTKLQKIVGPLSLTTLYNTLRYYDDTKEYDEAMSGKLTAFQYEMYLHENQNLLNFVIDQAQKCDFPLRIFTESHIQKSMLDPETYGQIMSSLGKYDFK
jgi:hypothetical protein